MKYSLILILCALSTTLFSQDTAGSEHFIEVTGKAEMEIEPNEIHTMIRIREFEENREKTSLEKLDAAFLKALKNAGIDRNRLELADAGSLLDTFRRKDQEPFRSKTYQIKLSSAAELENLLKKLGSVEVDRVAITRVHHSDYERLLLDLKTQALRNAKTKAETLLKSIGAETGRPILVREWDIHPFEPAMMNEMTMMKAGAEEGAQQDPTAFRKIKLQAQITARFEIR